ncbi:MAG: hypothetical protein PVJ36_07140 [Nitrospirota bacterium]|jgi:hypothetical protein
MLNARLATNWVEDSKRTNKELYSELDLLLRALDRFFNLEDIPPSSVSLTSKNFIVELDAGLDAIIKVLSILERIIPAARKNAYLFQKFAEDKFLTGKRRNAYRDELYKQDTPEKSLYRLYGSFLNLKSIVNDLKRNEFIEYMSFKNLGQLVSKEIRENVYFNPFKRQIDPELDHIGHGDIVDIVKGIDDRDSKKLVSVTFLFLFRFLRYLDHINYSSIRLSELHPSLLIISLLNSETEVFRTYLKRSVVELRDKELAGALETLSYQFTMESKRVYQQELRDIFEYETPNQLRGKIENSHGILRSLIGHTIIYLAQHWKPEIRGEDIFSDFVDKTEQSVTLRENIYILSRVLMRLEECADDPEEGARVLKSLKTCMGHFEKTTFKMLRYDDFDEFQNFFVETMPYEVDKDFKKFLSRCQYFIVFLDTTLRHIGNRAELKDLPLDVEKAEEVVDQFVKAAK